MEIPQRTTQSLWIIILIVAFVAATLGFAMSFQDEQARFSDMSSLSSSHLIYALQLKDDMALIDWSKSLEKLPSILAFRARSDSKVWAEGGNVQACPPTSTNGITYKFPYQWVVCSSFHKDAITPVNVIFVFQDFRGPLTWSLCLFFICLGLGWGLIHRGALQKKESLSPPSTITPIHKNTTVAKQIVASSDDKSVTLTLDKDYMVCQATPLAAKALNRQVSDLVGSHFLDLLPDPEVMKAIEESKEIKLLKPFPSHPHLSALLQPQPEGTLLVFETKPKAERA